MYCGLNIIIHSVIHWICHDENEAEAESFSTYSVQCVQEALEEFGCKIRKIDCKAEEADMTWLGWSVPRGHPGG